MDTMKIARRVLVFLLLAQMAFLAKAQQSGLPAPTSSNISFFNQYVVDVESNPLCTGSTAGDRLVTCLGLVAAFPKGAVFDMRGVVSEPTQPVSSGTSVFEVGRFYQQHVIWPDCNGPTNSDCGMTMHTASVTLPAPTVSVGTPAITGGSLPADTYHIYALWQTGDAPGAQSTELTCTIASGSTGVCPIVVPTTCPQYATQLRFYVSNTAMGGSNAETWQATGSCSSNGTAFNITGPLYPHSAPVPTTPLSVPMVVVHNNKSTFYAPFTGQNGFPFYTTGTTAGADMLATTDNGYSGIQNLYFSNNGNAPIVCGVYDQGTYIHSIRDHIGVYPGPGSAYCISGQYNDVTLKDLNLSCGSSTGTSALTISWAPETGTDVANGGGDVEGIHGLIFEGGLINTKGCPQTGPSVAITGRNGATANGLSGWVNNNGTILGVEFRGTRMELNGQGIVATDASYIVLNSVFGVGNASGTAFLTINQNYAPSGQLYGVGGFDVQNTQVAGWTDAILNNVSADPAATIAIGASGTWMGEYGFGGNGYSRTAGATNFSHVYSNTPFLFDSSSPIDTWSHINLHQTTAPVATTCGSGTAAGADGAFKVTGITSATACTVTFNKPVQLGICVGPVSQLSSLPVGITSVSTTAVTFNFATTVTSLYASCF